ncbi:MAG: DUF4178 domain-containing protein [Myxococcales bacterium]|nr:DUF4178 domain-containing protein [Myxococcales bacterium]
MEYLLLAGLLASGLGSLALYARRRKRQRQQHDSAEQARADVLSEPRDVDQARPGDVVVLDEGDSLVQGVVRFGEGARSWIECRLLDVSVERWIVVRPDDSSGLVVGERIDGLPLRGEPPEAIDHDGRIYQLERYGEARIEVEGDAGGYAVGELEFWDYRCTGSERLWIRRSGNAFRSFAGRRDPRHMIEFIPGGGAL